MFSICIIECVFNYFVTYCILHYRNYLIGRNLCDKHNLMTFIVRNRLKSSADHSKLTF